MCRLYSRLPILCTARPLVHAYYAELHYNSEGITVSIKVVGLTRLQGFHCDSERLDTTFILSIEFIPQLTTRLTSRNYVHFSIKIQWFRWYNVHLALQPPSVTFPLSAVASTVGIFRVCSA